MPNMRYLQAISVKVSEEAAGTLSCVGTTLRLASGLAAIDLDDRTCSVIDVEGEPGGCLERAGEQGPAPDRALRHWLAIVENQSNGCRAVWRLSGKASCNLGTSAKNSGPRTDSTVAALEA